MTTFRDDGAHVTTKLASAITATEFYTVADHVFCFQAYDMWSAQLFREFLDGFYFHALGDRPPRQTIRQTIILGCGIPAAVRNFTPPVKRFDVERGFCETDGISYRFHIEDSLIVVTSSEKTVEVWIAENPRARRPQALVNVLSYAIQAALRRSGLYLLHAAGVVAPGGNGGALIVGNSGSGKSTLTVRLAHQGWSYLSDDMVLLENSTEGVAAYGHRRPFAISEAALAACELDELIPALGRPVMSDPNKRRLIPHEVFVNKHVTTTQPRAIFFPAITDTDTSRVVALDSSDAMIRLIRICPWASYEQKDISREHLLCLQRLVKQTEAYVLHAGRDLLRNRTRASTLINSYLM